MNLKQIKTRITQELQTEYDRYSTYKIGRLVALLIYVLTFLVIPKIMMILVPWMTDRFSERQSYIIITFLAVSIVQIGWWVIMPIIYLNKIPFFEQYRHNPNLPWPWEQQPNNWPSLLKKTIWVSLFNLFFSIPMKIMIDSSYAFKVVMDMSQTPPFSQIAIQFFLILFLQDTFLFFFHQLLHLPLFYKFHKLHHQYKNTVSFASFHVDIGQVIISQAVGTFFVYKIASLYAPIHISFIVIFLMMRTSDANGNHCGYNFSWLPMQVLPFCANDDFHDFHHTRNVGNYAPYFRIWDSIFGSNEEFRKYKAKKMNQQAKIVNKPTVKGQ